MGGQRGTPGSRNPQRQGAKRQPKSTRLPAGNLPKERKLSKKKTIQKENKLKENFPQS